MPDLPKEPRRPVYFTVPPQTDPKPCDGPNCRKPVYWIRTPKGAKAPIDCAADTNCYAPTDEREGYGVIHFGTCVDALRFRRFWKMRKAQS
jgi:hypothetical protein